MRPACAASLIAILAAQGGCEEPGRTPPPGADARGSGTREQAAGTRRSTEPARPSGLPVDVTFTASDGVVLSATLRPGGTANAPAVILAHQLAHDRREWASVVELLSQPEGLTTLALDLRGHGASVRAPDGSTLAWSSFAAPDWTHLDDDVRAAVAYVRAGAGRSLAPSAMVLVGSSIGSSACLRVAGADDAIAGVAAISPGRAFRGLDAISPLRGWGRRPLLLVATRGDRGSAETVGDMGRLARGATVRLVPGHEHGLAMASELPSLAEEIAGFVRDTTGAARR